jgi:hypothetical protein
MNYSCASSSNSTTVAAGSAIAITDSSSSSISKDSNIENPSIKAEIDKMIYEIIKGEPYDESLEIEDEEEEESVTAIAEPAAIIAAPVAEADDDAQE